MSKKADISEVLDRFLTEKKYGCYRNCIYENVGTHWRILKLDEVQRSFRRNLTESENRVVTSGQINEVERRIITDYRFELKEQEVEHPMKLHVQNGVIDLETGELISNSKEQFLYQLNFSYVGDKTVEKDSYLRKFLATSLNNQKKEQLLLETVGYIISEITDAHVAIFYYGESGTGKSMILNLVKKVIGDENTTAITFDDIGSRFNKACLAGSKINICSEMQGGKFKNEGIFKAIVSNERIMAEHKGENPFEFQVKTKLLTAGNVFPEFSVGAGMEAILRRIVVVRFTTKIPVKDINLEKKLWEERDVMFSLAVNALIELIRREYEFTKTEDSEVFFQTMRRDATALDDFIESECIRGGQAQVHLVKLIERFEQFQTENGYDVRISTRELSQKIASLEGVTREKFRMHGKALWGFKGIRLMEKNCYKNSSNASGVGRSSSLIEGKESSCATQDSQENYKFKVEIN